MTLVMCSITRILIVAFCFPVLVLEANLIDPRAAAGVVERPIEREIESRPLEPLPDPPVLGLEDLEVCPEGQEETIFIGSISFCGQTIFTEQELQCIVADYYGCDLTMGKIEELCAKIQAAYVERGYFLAHAFAPEQDIENDKLLIEIMEGRIGKVMTVGNCFYSDRFIARYFAQLKNCPVNYDELITALLLLNENADLDAALVFKKGDCPGTTDIILEVDDALPLHASIDVNNFGVRPVGMERIGSRLEYGNLLWYGDYLSVAEVIGSNFKQLNFTDVIYSVPLNSRGTYLQFSYIYNIFEVREPEELHLKGKAHIASIELSQAIARARNLSVDGYVSFDYEQFKNYALGRRVSLDNLRVLSFGLSADFLDCCRGRNIGTISIDLGLPRFLGGSKSIDKECARKGSGNGFFTFDLSYTRIQYLEPRCFLLFNFSGQISPSRLPLAEQIYIGGFDTVRGYSTAAALGDSGYYTNLEVRFPFPWFVETPLPYFCDLCWGDALQFLCFIDHGDVFLNGRESNLPPHRSLTGTGVGVRVYGPYGISLSCDVGLPIGGGHHHKSPMVYLKGVIAY